MTQWNIDAAHSEINFRVKHLLISTVTGGFGRFSALIRSGADDFSDAVVSFEAEIDSINTGNDQRDGHLKSADFFDAGKYPKMTFASTGLRKLSEHELRVTGDLSIRGVTKQVELDVIYNGTVTGFGGTRVAGFEIRAKVNRFDFGLTWNALTEAGGVTVGNEVKIEILAEFTRPAEAVRAA